MGYQIFRCLTLVRWNNNRLKFNLSQELDASTDNQIHFNPKGNVWNEEFRFEKQFKSFIVNLSFFHRCKHNIDNSGLSDYINITDTISQRNIVLTGLLSGIQVKWYFFNQSVDVICSANAEYYIYKEDYRYPSKDISENWEDFKFSTFFSLRPEYRLSPGAGIYLLGWINPVYAKGNKLKSNYRIEAGCYAGKSYRLYLFVAGEYWFADVSKPYPAKLYMNYCGIRIGY